MLANQTKRDAELEIGVKREENEGWKVASRRCWRQASDELLVAKTRLPSGIFLLAGTPIAATSFNEAGEDVVCKNWDLSTLRKEGSRRVSAGQIQR